MSVTIFRAGVALVLAAAAPLAAAQFVGKISDPVEWVNPLMGTASKPEMSNGNTYPAIAVPWGMNLWTPQTGKMGNGWTYQYDADKLRGLKQTHQPSPWMNDYGQFSVMPVIGAKRFTEDDRASAFSHKAETSKPYYYSVYLADANVTAELTPTERAAQFRFTFPESDKSYVVVDAFDKGSYVKIIPEQRKVIGYSTRYARGPLPSNFRLYFVMVFDKPFNSTDVWRGKELVEGALEMESQHSGAIVGFKTGRGEQVHMKVASSFISPEQAELNLQRELADDDFDATRARAKAAWNRVLSKVEVEGGSIDQMRTFYSSLYRMVQFPNKMYEIDAAGQPVHWSPYNGKVLPGYLFAGTGFWDTFRALYPFLNLVYPSINREMQAGLANAYREGGWLPEWSSPGYADIMVGNNSASVVADAWIKGSRSPDIETLWQALKHGAGNEGPVSAVGRAGVKYYNELGYVPYDVKINENAARTLEYAYDDFAIYQLGKALGKPESEIGVYAQRAMNYKKLFDPETGLMRGRNKDGSFQSPFNPVKWGDAFTEGNSWHYTWSVFHDIDGLVNLMGGRAAFVNKLDTVMSMPPVFDESYYGSVIHEIREMQVANMGQYAHGNQPIQHMLYLYNYAGAPWKSQYWIRETLNRMYKPTPDGYCGDEDNGQTSAWYVFSALGFYPVTPAVGQYVVGAPLFQHATVHLENGKQVRINAPGNSATARYIRAAKLNGRPLQRNWLGHDELLRGATFDVEMSAQPNQQRGIAPADAPYSFSRAEATATSQKR